MRQYVEDNVIPIVDDFYERGAFPMEVVRPLGELGVYGANLPTEYGCAGMNNVAYGLVMQELERGDSGLRRFVSVQGALVMYPIFTFGSEEHRQKWLPKLATGEAIGCFGLTEPDHGSDPGGMETRARKTSDGFVLNGAKAWITNGSIADVAVVWAKTTRDVCAVTSSRRERPDTARPRSTASTRFGPRSPRSSFSTTSHPRREPPSRIRRPESAVDVPQPGAVRHRVGRHRRRDGVLRHGASIRARPRRSSANPLRVSSSCRRSSWTW